MDFSIPPSSRYLSNVIHDCAVMLMSSKERNYDTIKQICIYSYSQLSTLLLLR